MIVEFHDAEAGNTLCAKHKNLDYDYQAEMGGAVRPDRRHRHRPAGGVEE
jgi:hypothetical protein